MDLGHVDDAKNVAGRAGLDQEPESIGAIVTDGAGTENVRWNRAPVIIAGDLCGAGFLDLKVGLDVLDQARLLAQDRLGIIVEVGIGISPRRHGRRDQRHGDCRKE